MNAFLLAAAALTLVALLLLFHPWWRGRARSGDSRHLVQQRIENSADLNTAVHRDRFAELEHDHANGLISAAGYAEAREELQRQLLMDTGMAEPQAEDAASARPWRALLLAAVLLPAAATGLYAVLGAPAALLSTADRTAVAATEMNDLIVSLEQRMAQNPGDTQGWVLLARAYKIMGRWDDAERAYGRVGALLQTSAELLTELADVLVQKSESFTGRPHELITQALQLEPNNPKALLLAGAEAFAGKSYAVAVGHWERLLAQMDPASDEAQVIASGIARARDLGNVKVGAGNTVALASPTAKASDAATDAATLASAVSGRVELSAALRSQTTPDETVFIFARAVKGPRMPLAVQRVRVADLPYDFKLDDSQAMSPQSRISSAQALRIEVRVSKSGQAMPGKGDLTGNSGIVKPGDKNVHVLVDQQTK